MPCFVFPIYTGFQSMEPYHIQLLKAKYEDKRRHNPRFTLRSMARLVAIDPGSLSQILKQKRQLPKSEWIQFSEKLKLSEIEKRKFLDSLWIEFNLKKKVVEELEVHSKLLDEKVYAEIIEEWEFAAAICLLDVVGGSQFAPESLQNYLGLSEFRAKEIYTKLFQYGLLEMKEGIILTKSPAFNTSEDTLSHTLQRAHEKELALISKKMKSVSPDEREITSLTFSGNKKDILLMKEWIRLRRDEFQVKFEGKEPNEVYLFSLQLVPLLERKK